MKRFVTPLALAWVLATVVAGATQTAQRSVANTVHAQCGAELTRMQRALPASRSWSQFTSELDAALAAVARALRDDPGVMQATLKDDAASLRQTIARDSGSDRRAAAASVLRLCVIEAVQRFSAASGAAASAVGPADAVVDFEGVLARILNSPAGPTPPIPLAGATVDERAVDLLNACNLEVRAAHGALISTGRSTGDAASSVTTSARVTSTRPRADVLVSWEQRYWLRLEDDADGLYVRCLAKRRVEQIDDMEHSDRSSVTVMQRLLETSGALGSASLSPTALAVTTVPLSESHLDARVEDIARACSSQIVAMFAAAAEPGASTAPVGGSRRPADWLWYVIKG